MVNHEVQLESGALRLEQVLSKGLLTLTEDEHGFTVRIGDRYQDGLGRDEALWCVVQFLTGAVPCRYLRSQAEHDAWNAKYGIKPGLEPWQKQLPSPAGAARNREER